jgi:hypothetical protein
MIDQLMDENLSKYYDFYLGKGQAIHIERDSEGLYNVWDSKILGNFLSRAEALDLAQKFSKDIRRQNGS